MSKKNVFVVIPTIRPERMLEWYTAWQSELESVDAKLIVVEDNSSLSDLYSYADQAYSWAEINADLKDVHWIIPRRNSVIRTYGFLKAHQQGADIVITLDDDVMPEKDCLREHVYNLTEEREDPAWCWTAEIRTRGLPYHNTHRSCIPVISHGLWTGVPDQDAISQLYDEEHDAVPVEGVVPRGTYFPMCWMNLAFSRSILPAIVPVPMGQGEEFDRFEDIWAGVIAKKVCDHLGLTVWSGSPLTHHTRASNPFTNLVKEAKGVGENENFWEIIDGIQLTQTTPELCTREIGKALCQLKSPFYNRLGNTILEWITALNRSI